ncbi:CBS domain-containing protein [Thermodesulfobacterium sp. TA1]|uniref:CBS domain-containing protein n=1 Tax=Thermodesulfobacterium sp. TA1 TaxID=2234087 RepID=UPI001231BA5D|nr:CBS domain-containing protein [Thermodesulfobacterium sp. TA1]QER42468.1 CBS domain-containing protein [Thermodesulfobacterium sp. TA1]
MGKVAEDIMNKKLENISADATVYDAIERLIDKRIRSLLVLPKDPNDDYGVVTVRNIIFKVLSKHLDPHKVKIGDIASKPVLRVSKNTPIEKILELMDKNNIARVFVSDEEGKIIGVVSFFDVLNNVLVEQAKK